MENRGEESERRMTLRFSKKEQVRARGLIFDSESKYQGPVFSDDHPDAFVDIRNRRREWLESIDVSEALFRHVTACLCERLRRCKRRRPKGGCLTVRKYSAHMCLLCRSYCTKHDKNGRCPSATANIYALIDPRDGKIKYVGRTIHDPPKRFSGHRAELKRMLRFGGDASKKLLWLNALRKRGLEPKIVLLEKAPVTDLKAEKKWMVKCVRANAPLTNREASAIRRRSRAQ